MREVTNAVPVDDVIATKLDEYRHPYWLTPITPKGVLVANFRQAGVLELDFGGRTASGLCLSDKKHRNLLDDVILLLGMQTHVDSLEHRASRGGSEHSEKAAVDDASTVIDYFLVRATEFNLAERGFSAITENQLRQVLVDLASHSNVHDSVYKWRTHLNNFIQDVQRQITDNDVENAKISHPDIADLSVEQADMLQAFTAEQIVRARVYLFKHSLVKRSSSEGYEWTPNSLKLAQKFYKGTLRGCNQLRKWPVPRELCWHPKNRYQRECKNASIACEDGHEIEEWLTTERTFRRYLRRLLTFKLLAKYGRGVPMSSIAPIETLDYRDALKIKPPGRTFTLPPNYVLECMGKAVDLFFMHGEHLFESYFNVLKAAHNSHQTVPLFVATHDIAPYCTQETLKLGVKHFQLSRVVGYEAQRRSWQNQPPMPYKEFFDRVRRWEGLSEAVEALLGGMALTIGTLMAARDGELDDLKVDECLSETHRWMTLRTRKSGTPDHRNADARPLPEIANLMTQLLQRFHEKCRAEGIRCPEYLFSLPERHRVTGNARALDLFIDFIDAPKLADGSRYYIRQHMLRRFFAIVFFCHAGFEGLAPLRWMLRHSDIEHVYNYITETIPGRMMRLIKATAASMMVRAGNVEYVALADFLKKYLGTDRFDVMSQGELTTHIEYLQNIGAVVIEPVFLDQAGRKDFHIGVQIWERSVDQACEEA